MWVRQNLVLSAGWSKVVQQPDGMDVHHLKVELSIPKPPYLLAKGTIDQTRNVLGCLGTRVSSPAPLN